MSQTCADFNNTVPHRAQIRVLGVLDGGVIGVSNKANQPTPWLQLLRTWFSRMESRDAMLRMSERERRDAGLTGYDVDAEIRKPFWRA